MSKIMNIKSISKLKKIKINQYSSAIFYKIFDIFLKRNKAELYIYHDLKRQDILDKIISIKNEVDMLLTYSEALLIYNTTLNTTKIKGDIAEVGVYQGGSAKLICIAKGNKKLHLFDTFSGLPKLSNYDDKNQFKTGMFDTEYLNVKKYLKNFNNVYFYKGYFPNTTRLLKKTKYSFVHLDLDIYQSTLDALKYFYPKMNKGGVIISHDYVTAPGVNRAFNEYFKNKPEIIIETSSSQCLVIKI